MSPLAMPSNKEGLIQPSMTSHPPKFTPLTLESPSNPSTWKKQEQSIQYKEQEIGIVMKTFEVNRIYRT